MKNVVVSKWSKRFLGFMFILSFLICTYIALVVGGGNTYVDNVFELVFIVTCSLMCIRAIVIKEWKLDQMQRTDIIRQQIFENIDNYENFSVGDINVTLDGKFVCFNIRGCEIKEPIVELEEAFVSGVKVDKKTAIALNTAAVLDKIDVLLGNTIVEEAIEGEEKIMVAMTKEQLQLKEEEYKGMGKDGIYADRAAVLLSAASTDKYLMEILFWAKELSAEEQKSLVLVIKNTLVGRKTSI